MLKKKKHKAAEHPVAASAEGFSEQQIEKMIRENLKKTGKALSPEELEMEFQALRKVFIQGVSPMEALGFTQGLRDFMYAQAFNLYNLGKYKEANGIFKILCGVEGESPKNHMGLAATFHQMKDYEHAIPVYITAYYLDPTTPVPLYHAIDCYINLENAPSAYLTVIWAIDACGEDAKYAAIKTKCLAMKEKLGGDLGLNTEKPEEEEPDIFKKLKESA